MNHLSGEDFVVQNYGKIPIKQLAKDSLLSEHYVRKIARGAGLVKRGSPKKVFSEQLVPFTVSVKRKYLRQAEAEVSQIINKYKK